MIYNVSYLVNGERHECSATSFQQFLNELQKLLEKSESKKKEEKVELGSIRMTFHVATAIA